VIDAIIFDLDNCLAAADEVGAVLLEPMFAAIRDATRSTVADPGSMRVTGVATASVQSIRWADSSATLRDRTRHDSC